ADRGTVLARLRLGDADLLLRQLDGLVLDHVPHAEGLVFAGLTVDLDPHVGLAGEALLGGRRQRGLDRLEDDRLVDALLVGDGINDQQDFFAHIPSPPRGVASRSRFALSIWPRGTVISIPFSSTTTWSPRSPRRTPLIR